MLKLSCCAWASVVQDFASTFLEQECITNCYTVVLPSQALKLIPSTHLQVTYNPKKVDYTDLLESFMKGHNPTQLDGQGGDVGSQYRSGIYYYNEEHKAVAERYLREAQRNYKVSPPGLALGLT